MTRPHIIVVGGVAAGPAAVAEARRTNPDARITLIEKGKNISYSACEMPLLLASELESADQLVRYTPEAFAAKFNTDVRLLMEAESIDVEKRRLQVRDLKTQELSPLRYDRLVIATGSRATMPEALLTTSRDAYVLRSLEDVRQIAGALSGASVRHVVVVGAGYVGLDAAWAMRKRGLRVTLLAPSGMLAGHIPGEMSQVVAAHLRSAGIQVRAERANGVEKAGDGRVIALLTEQGEKIGCDLVLMATGTAPVTEWVLDSGLKVGSRAGIVVDDQMRTSEQGIWACGDCTERTELIFQQQILAPLSLNAFRSGRVAGRNAARSGHGRPAKISPLVHAAALGLGGLEIGHTGWTLEGARSIGKDVVSAAITHRTASSKSPHDPIHVRLVAEKGSKRLVGGQIVGGPGSAQRVNVLTTLIRASGTVDDLYDVDFVYAPSLAPAHDALFVAARSLQKSLL
jgi:NADPH-dependent 2,4-dienoyl-CoA reductase/sulfur reductase-like enzyme